MRFAEMIERCVALERRAAAMYRRFAAESDAGDELRAVWTRLAAEEEEHAAGIAGIAAGAVEHRIDGWTEAVGEAERVLREADALPAPSRDERLALALDLERTEIDALRELMLVLAGAVPASSRATSGHAAELAEIAARCSTDAGVQLKASLVRAHQRIAGS